MMAAPMPALLTVEAALAAVLFEVAPVRGIETMALMAAAGRVLAAPVVARLTQPPFAASAMDGYAVRAADMAGGSARLQVVGEAAAGHAFAGVVGVGQAVRIFTGAPLPAGSDAIVIQENTSRNGDFVQVIGGVIDPEHVRPRGGDFTAGQTLLEPGRLLNSRDVTLAAAMGHAGLPVRRRPRVAILATGDELVLPGSAMRADQIVCSNPYGVAGLVQAAGGEATFLGIAADTRASLREHILRAHEADVLVTLGGASVGDHDLVGPVLRELGLELAFWKIAMRPGKPLMFGRLAAQRVLGLPGNPVSSMVTAQLFLVPLVHALLGRSVGPAALTEAVVSVALSANGPRAHYMRARLRRLTDGQVVVTPMASQDSSLLLPLAEADCLIVRPMGAAAVAEGAGVQILRFEA